MRYSPFDLERWASTYEHRVAFNLSESGVHPMTPSELLALAGESIDSLAETRLGYGQSNGSDLLRDRIADLYPGATEANVLVTIGGIEANFTAMWHFLSPGGKATVMLPNYMQVPGLLQSFGAEVVPFHLVEANGWQPDLDELETHLRAGADFILVTNPCNPTGSILTDESRSGILALAAQHGAWILADEVYSGAELAGGDPTPTLWGSYDRIVATNSLSKAYGLPGLRLGWIVAPTERVEDLWGRKDYTSISPPSLSDSLACVALDPVTRPRVLERTRDICRKNLSVLTDWMDARVGQFTYRPPDAGAICFPHYTAEIDSLELADRLRTDADVLVIPGTHFGVDQALRIGYGPPEEELREGLERMGRVFDDLGDGALRRC
jgi:aspartate/methionine/tyrosine aminotransferase